MKEKNKVLEILFFSLISILLVIFYVFKTVNLRWLFGGIILLLLAIRQILFESRILQKGKDKKVKIKIYDILMGFLLFFLSIISFSIPLIINGLTDYFILIGLVIFVVFLLLLFFFWSRLEGGQKAFSILSFVLPFDMFSYTTFGAVMPYLSENGFGSGAFYGQVLLLILVILGYTTLTFRAFFEVLHYLFQIKEPWVKNKVLHFNLAISFTILAGGYYYLIYVSNNDLKDFLIMLGVLLSLWLAASQSLFQKTTNNNLT